jgi:hypothetical protein
MKNTFETCKSVFGFWGIFCLVAVAALMLYSIRIYSVDDPYIYYNYAKRICMGNFLAYDNRNIPSEGFTSILFTLVLVPFQYLGLNLPWSTVAINIVSLGVSMALAYKIFFKRLNIHPQYAFAFVLSCLLLIYMQRYALFGLLGFGLEGMFGLMLSMLALDAFLAWIAAEKHQAKALLLALCYYFLCYLTRPEALVVFLPLLMFGAIKHRQSWLNIAGCGLAFLSTFGLYLAWKFYYFGDIFPTGYYRKMNLKPDDIENGPNYIKMYLFTSRVLFLLIISAIIVLYRQSKLKPIYQKHRHAILGFGLLWLSNCLFTINTTAIVGFFMRYVVLANFILIISAALCLAYLWQSLCNTWLKTYTWAKQAFPLVVLLMFGLLYVVFYKNAEHTYSEVYEGIGQKLQKSFQNQKKITFASPDAGAIQYNFDGDFIDTNGLAEPYIARLFKYKFDPKVNNADSIMTYYQKQNIDFYIQGYSDKGLDKGLPNLLPNPHTPLTEENTVKHLALWQKNGIHYVGSIKTRLPYDLVFFINTRAKNYAETQKVLASIVDKNSLTALCYRSKTNQVIFKKTP